MSDPGNTENQGTATEASEPPPKSFNGLMPVLIFVGIAVMISLVWTQWQQVQRRGVTTLETHGTLTGITLFDALANRQSTIPGGEEDFLVIAALSVREPGVAPMLAGRMRDLARQLDRLGERRVRLVVITIDPAHDTAEVLAEYAAAMEAEPGRWSFLTGPPPDVDAWIRKDLYGPLLADGNDLPAAPTRLVLVDPHGNIRSYRDAQNPGVVGNLLEDIGALVREFNSPAPQEKN